MAAVTRTRIGLALLAVAVGLLVAMLLPHHHCDPMGTCSGAAFYPRLLALAAGVALATVIVVAGPIVGGVLVVPSLLGLAVVLPYSCPAPPHSPGPCSGLNPSWRGVLVLTAVVLTVPLVVRITRRGIPRTLRLSSAMYVVAAAALLAGLAIAASIPDDCGLYLGIGCVPLHRVGLRIMIILVAAVVAATLVIAGSRERTTRRPGEQSSPQFG